MEGGARKADISWEGKAEPDSRIHSQMAREILGPLPLFPHLYEFLRIPRGAPGLDWEPLSWGLHAAGLQST